MIIAFGQLAFCVICKQVRSFTNKCRSRGVASNFSEFVDGIDTA